MKDSNVVDFYKKKTSSRKYGLGYQNIKIIIIINTNRNGLAQKILSDGIFLD